MTRETEAWQGGTASTVVLPALSSATRDPRPQALGQTLYCYLQSKSRVTWPGQGSTTSGT